MYKVAGSWAAGVALACGLAGTLLAGTALAQQSGRVANRPLIVQRDVSIDAAAIGRARMTKWDCLGALEAFDVALRSSVDPTIRRDRGRCHERLGYTYPAIDDYRAYLTERPNAPDSDDISARLLKLEDEAAKGPSASVSEVPSQYHWGPQMAQSEVGASATASGSGGGSSGGGGGSASGSGEVKAEASLSTSGTESSESASSSSSSGKGPKIKGRSLDEIEEDELLDQDAKNSPLRRGSGFIIGPYFMYRRWGISSTNIGGGYGVGASFRQSFGGISTLLLELGYVAYQSSSDASIVTLQTTLSSQRQGFGGTLGYEARIRLDPRVTNALTIVAGVELDKLAYQQTSDTFTTLLARGRLGFRHVLGPSLGLEAAFDLAFPFYSDGSICGGSCSAVSSSWQVPLVGVYVALVVGF